MVAVGNMNRQEGEKGKTGMDSTGIELAVGLRQMMMYVLANDKRELQDERSKAERSDKEDDTWSGQHYY